MNPGDSDKHMVWIYPDQESPPRGVKIALLTIGNIEVTGNWTDDGRYKAWQRLFSRDKEHEKNLKASLSTSLHECVGTNEGVDFAKLFALGVLVRDTL
jgi:hypothetical protein